MSIFLRMAATLVLTCIAATSAFGQSRPPIEKVVAVDGINLRYVEQGQGEPVVFVHGAVADWRAWEMQREAVAGRYQFIALARRYYGTEPWIDDGKQFGPVTDAADLAAFVKGLNRGPVHLVAWSGGSPGALRVVSEHPELFRSLFVFETPTGVSFPGDVELNRLITQFNDGRAGVGSAVQRGDVVTGAKLLVEWAFGMPAGAFSHIAPRFQKMVLDNARTLTLTAAPAAPITCAMLAPNKVPTRMVASSANADTLMGAIARRVAACFGNGRMTIMSGVAHGAPVQHPEVFNRELLDFLASVKGKQPQASR